MDGQLAETISCYMGNTECVEIYRHQQSKSSRLGRCERLQRHFARDGVVDDRFGIIPTDPHIGTVGNFRRRFPRTMQPGVRQLREFGAPAAHIVAVRIKLFALADQIEDAEVRPASAPLPAVHCQPSVFCARSASTEIPLPARERTPAQSRHRAEWRFAARDYPPAGDPRESREWTTRHS